MIFCGIKIMIYFLNKVYIAYEVHNIYNLVLINF